MDFQKLLSESTVETRLPAEKKDISKWHFFPVRKCVRIILICRFSLLLLLLLSLIFKKQKTTEKRQVLNFKYKDNEVFKVNHEIKILFLRLRFLADFYNGDVF